MLNQENLGNTALDCFTEHSRIPDGTSVAVLDLDCRLLLNVISMRDSPLSRDADGFLEEVERTVAVLPKGRTL